MTRGLRGDDEVPQRRSATLARMVPRKLEVWNMHAHVDQEPGDYEQLFRWIEPLRL